MAKMRTMRMNVVTGDTDCLPDLLAAVTAPCLRGAAQELEVVLRRAPGYCKSPAGFWAAVLYALGWNPDPRRLFKLRVDIRDVIIACRGSNAFLEAKGGASPAATLLTLLTDNVGDYGRAAQLVGVEVLVKTPQFYGPMERTFAAVSVEYTMPEHDDKTVVTLAQLNPFTGLPKEIYTPDLLCGKQMYSIEVLMPDDLSVPIVTEAPVLCV